MSMNEELAAYYGTGGLSAEAMEKEAQVELFSKFAAENGIDLNQLSEGQIAELWDYTFSKQAGDEDGENEEEEDEEEEKKKESMAKFAEADYYGRVMAHAMVQELNKIAAPAGDSLPNSYRAMNPGLNSPASPSDGPRLGSGVKNQGRNEREALRKADILNDHKPKKLYVTPKGDTKAAIKEKLTDRLKRYGNAYLDAAKFKGYGDAKGFGGKAGVIAKGTGAIAAPLALLGGGAYLATRDSKEKRSYDLNFEAAAEAVIKVAEAGYDADQAVDLIGDIVAHNPGDTEKTASIHDVDTLVSVRALELAEAAGYPVNW